MIKLKKDVRDKMRIQLLVHGIPDKIIWRRGQWLTYYFKKFGHKVDLIGKNKWKGFYLRYLKFRPDVIIVQGPIGFIPIILKKIKLINVPIVCDWNDDYTDIMGKKYGIDRIAFLEHFVVKHANFIITPSKFLQRKCEIWGKKVFYVSHGVSPDFMKDKPYKLSNKINIVYAGSQVEFKMVDLLVKTVKKLNCNLYLIGEINEKLKKIASSNVHFMGAIKFTEIPKYLRGADILVSTTDDDSALKVFEYIKAGKTILALKGRVGYLLDHYVNSYLTEDFSEGLKTLIRDKKLRDILAKNVKKIKVYTWKEIAKMYIEILNDVVKFK